MLPATTERVAINTADEVNRQIRQQTKARIEATASRGPLAIERRLHELDEEWDIERCLETMAPTITLLGIGLGLTRGRSWFLLPIMVQSFFLQHALHGWCPPIPVLRRLGVRTCTEIEEERYALKALRGDFRHIASSLARNEAEGAAAALKSVRS
jgi:hypothetical protein